LVPDEVKRVAHVQFVDCYGVGAQQISDETEGGCDILVAFVHVADDEAVIHIL
jgi:hypothetical protein